MSQVLLRSAHLPVIVSIKSQLKNAQSLGMGPNVVQVLPLPSSAAVHNARQDPVPQSLLMTVLPGPGRVVPQEQLMPEALQLARAVARHSRPVVAKAKDCIKRALEVPLGEGLRYEQCALLSP